MARWGQTSVSPEALNTAKAVFRQDLYDAALGFGATAERGLTGAVGAFTGPSFEADDIAGYLASFEVRRRRR
jgi:NitT/TauT family transport system ATP-binding protein